jgi:hypothetical protein
MLNKFSRLLFALPALLAAFSLAAYAADPSQVTAKVRNALANTPFIAELTVQLGPGGGNTSGKLSRMPPDCSRLEQYKSGKLASYYLEDAFTATKVELGNRRAYNIPGRRVNALFELVGLSLTSSLGHNSLSVSQGKSAGHKVLIMHGTADAATFTLIIGADDYLPREYAASPGRGKPGLTIRLNGLKVVQASQFPKGFFEVPQGYRVVGRQTSLGQMERERLRLFQSRLRGPLLGQGAPGASKAAAETISGGGNESWLPLLPMKMPPGFVIDTVMPLYFGDDLLYHVKLVEPGQLKLVSIFETQNQRLLDDFRRAKQPEGVKGVSREFNGTGIYVIILSDDLKQQQLDEIFGSLSFQPQVAVDLLNKALASLLAQQP